jgi:hypothetical protein
MDDLYRENILEHYKQPRNFGELPDLCRIVARVNRTRCLCFEPAASARQVPRDDRCLPIDSVSCTLARVLAQGSRSVALRVPGLMGFESLGIDRHCI